MLAPMSGTENSVSSATSLRRIMIVGTAGCGKSTLARQLAAELSLTAIELDALFWGTDWKPVPDAIFCQRITQMLPDTGWVVDGNYSKARELLWCQADTVIWLDYPLWIILPRLLRRTLTHIVMRQELWNGNRETLRNAIFAPDSIIRQVLRVHRKLQKRYNHLFVQPEYSHMRLIRFRSPRATQIWLAHFHFPFAVSEQSYS